MKSEDRGLIGITVDEREVLLSDSTPHVKEVKMNLKSPDEVEYDLWLDEQFRQIARDYDYGTFVRIVKVDSNAKPAEEKKVRFFYRTYNLRE